MDKWKALIIITTITTIAIIISSALLANMTVTWNVKMDDNTREWLIENDYCVITSNQPYNSGKPSIIFMGECQYFNESVIKND